VKRGARGLALVALASAWSLVLGCSILVDTGGLADGDDSAPAAPSDAAAADDRSARDALASDADDARPMGDADAKVGCPPPPDDPSLIAWYPFEETDGNVVLDCSGHNLDATLLASGTFQRVAGRSGRAIHLDSSGGCFDVGLAPALAFGNKPFTVAGWIEPVRFSRPPAQVGGNPVPQWFFGHVGTSTGVTRGWGIGTDDADEVEVKVFDDQGVFVEATTLVATNAWIHVAGVREGTQLQLYTGGVLTGSIATPSAPGIDPVAHGWLGCRFPGEPSYEGTLDDVRVYSRALSATEIAALAK
jgi:uncharacterized protein